MKKSKFITSSQAAEMCGVTTMTIRNLCKSGVFSYQLRNHLFCPCEADVKKYAKQVKEVHQSFLHIEDYKARILKEEHDYFEQLQEAQFKYRERLISMDMFPRRIDAIKEFLCAVLRSIERYIPQDNCLITERDIRICWLALQGKSFDEIGEDFRLTRESVRQVWQKTLRRFATVKGSFYHINSENDALREKVCEQADEIARLKAQLAGEEVLQRDETLRMSRLLAESVYGQDITVRSLNCLKGAEIHTFRDLCRFQRTDLLKCRNFGKKSLTELDELLESKGLHFGMNVDIYPEYIAPKIQ
jgi:hypothetical protein